jgi:nucleoside-diphosphate-sugar epimerase
MARVASDDPPFSIDTEAELEEFLTRPRPELIELIKSVSSPLILLGASGKMGPTLAVLARRAAEAAGHPLEVIAVSRFSDPKKRAWLQQRGVSTMACDLLDRSALPHLPPSKNVVYLVGLKFGTFQNPAQTWAINTLVPAIIAECYAGSRIVALSTGNVYPLSSTTTGGSVESDPLTPLGEYANAAVGRERIFEFFAQRDRTPLVLLRLFYAVELRYGVLRDLADKIQAGKPVDLANGWFNCIWQSDANEMILRSLAFASTPPTTLNLTSSQVFRVRTVAESLAELLGKPVRFIGQEREDALAGNTARARALLGEPPTSLDAMLRWTAAWVKQGGGSLGKPTNFEVRDGRY